MENQISIAISSLKPLTKETVKEIAQWGYEVPYDAYSYKGHSDEYLLDESTWGTEQFCLVERGILLGQLACQYEGDDLWVGWSMAPEFCGKGNGEAFVKKSIPRVAAAALGFVIASFHISRTGVRIDPPGRGRKSPSAGRF